MRCALHRRDDLRGRDPCDAENSPPNGPTALHLTSSAVGLPDQRSSACEDDVSIFFVAASIAFHSGGFTFSRLRTKKSKRLCSPYAPPFVCPAPGMTSRSNSLLCLMS